MRGSDSSSQRCYSSSIGEEIGVLWLVPARTMRATAAECLLPVTSHAIRRHRCDRGVGAGVATDVMTKPTSEFVGIRDGAPTTPSVPSLANTGLLDRAAGSPAFGSAQPFAAHGVRVAPTTASGTQSGSGDPEIVTGSRRLRSRSDALLGPHRGCTCPARAGVAVVVARGESTRIGSRRSIHFVRTLAA